MTTVLEPERHQTSPSEHRRPAFDKKSLPARYSGQMLYFLGAALIAGAVVHYPINPPLYAIICGVGAFVFLLGTIVNEFVLADERPALRQAISLVAFSLLLSFGVGLVGGGIQHFEQFPERSAWMTPSACSCRTSRSSPRTPRAAGGTSSPRSRPASSSSRPSPGWA